MSYCWAKIYPLMDHGGPIHIKKVSNLFVFFWYSTDTYARLIQWVAYRILIQLSDTLWVTVSVFHRG
jgi:hypothetical protein